MLSTRAAPLALLALAACAVVTPEPPSACPLIEPYRLAPTPEGWEFQPYTDPRILPTSSPDRLRYTFDAGGLQPLWEIDVCGGEPQQVLSSTNPHLSPLASNVTPSGEVIYFFDRLADAIVLARADLDVPREIAGLPYGELWARPAAHGRTVFYRRQTGPGPRRVAGLGAAREALYVHDGDPDHPAVRLVDDVVDWQIDGDLVALRDDGELRRVDLRDESSATLLAGVRAFERRGPHLVWQAIGDDIDEPMYLRDLDSGVEVPLGINDFCQQSWNRDPDDIYGPAGEWHFDPDRTLVALLGPEATLAAVHEVDTGAALVVPEHDLWDRWEDQFHLVDFEGETGDTTSMILWDPRAGVTHTWYRGPSVARPHFLTYDGHAVEYLDLDDPSRGTGSLWRVDLASGERTEVLPRMARFFDTLEDGRYVVEFPAGVDGVLDLVVVDRDDASYTTIAGRAHAVYALGRDPDNGYAYLDLLGPEPGLWVTPIPPK